MLAPQTTSHGLYTGSRDNTRLVDPAHKAALLQISTLLVSISFLSVRAEEPHVVWCLEALFNKLRDLKYPHENGQNWQGMYIKRRCMAVF